VQVQRKKIVTKGRLLERHLLLINTRGDFFVTYFVILNVNFCAFYELIGCKLTSLSHFHSSNA